MSTDPIEKLLTIEEVARFLHRSPRSVRRLQIPVVRIGRKPLYDREALQRFVESHKCQSLNVPDHRSTIVKSRSRGVGLFEALERVSGEKRRPSSGVSRKKFALKQDA